MACFLCENQLELTGFDVQTTNTSHSKIRLLLLLEQIVGDKFLTDNYIICTMCYHFLNELDVIKVRVREIEQKFKNYIQRLATTQTLDLSEECTVCFNRIPSKEYKAHFKTHYSDISDLSTSFDLDKNNFIPNSKNPDALTGIESKQVVEDEAKDQKTKTNNCVKPHKCPQCSKTWKTLAELKNHLSSHNKERPFICEICGQAYKRQQALTVHVGMHKGVNPFTCVYCNKSFTQKGALARHIPIHTGELPFQCDLCGKRFVHHSSFKMHKLSHTGQKSYKCDVCGMLLMSGSHLKRHMRVHTGEKRFACNICGKKFAEKYNLAAHEKLHQGVSKKKKYQCQICDNLYNGQVKLEEHLHNVHQKIQFPKPAEQIPA